MRGKNVVCEPAPTGSKRVGAVLRLRRQHSRAAAVFISEISLPCESELMSRFKIKVARIEAARGSRAVSVTFQIDRGAVSFQVPIHLGVSDYDDTEMVQAARSILHRTFAELATQSLDWKLSPKDLKLLSGMSLRVKK
jgi:hypothetical protein